MSLSVPHEEEEATECARGDEPSATPRRAPLRLAARSLTVRPTPAQDRGVRRCAGSLRGLGPAAREAGGGRTSPAPAEVASINARRFTTGLLGGCTTFFAFSLDAALIHERGDLGTCRGLPLGFGLRCRWGAS
jgi:hypothetical protein